MFLHLYSRECIVILWEWCLLFDWDVLLWTACSQLVWSVVCRMHLLVCVCVCVSVCERVWDEILAEALDCLFHSGGCEPCLFVLWTGTYTWWVLLSLVCCLSSYNTHTHMHACINTQWGFTCVFGPCMIYRWPAHVVSALILVSVVSRNGMIWKAGGDIL